MKYQFFTANVTGKREYKKGSIFHCQCGNEGEGRTNQSVLCILLSFWSTQSMVNGAVCGFLVLVQKMDGSTVHRPCKLYFTLLHNIYHSDKMYDEWHEHCISLSPLATFVNLWIRLCSACKVCVLLVHLSFVPTPSTRKPHTAPFTVLCVWVQQQ